MKFVLELWPDIDGDVPGEIVAASGPELLAYALESIKANPGLVWDILNDADELLHANVSVNDD